MWPDLGLAARARALALREEGIDLIVVDYLRLVQDASSVGESGQSSSAFRRSDTREHEVPSVSHGLKALAKLLETPVLALAQVNDKAVEGRADKRPMLFDYRESAAIVQPEGVQ